MSTLTWGACIYGLALVVSVRISFCPPQHGVVVRVLVCVTRGRGFEPHSARVSQTHFIKIVYMCWNLLNYNCESCSIAVKLLYSTLL